MLLSREFNEDAGKKRSQGNFCQKKKLVGKFGQ
jgi:hypothetical protein